MDMKNVTIEIPSHFPNQKICGETTLQNIMSSNPIRKDRIVRRFWKKANCSYSIRPIPGHEQLGEISDAHDRSGQYDDLIHHFDMVYRDVSCNPNTFRVTTSSVCTIANPEKIARQRNMAGRWSYANREQPMLRSQMIRWYVPTIPAAYSIRLVPAKGLHALPVFCAACPTKDCNPINITCGTFLRGLG